MTRVLADGAVRFQDKRRPQVGDGALQRYMNFLGIRVFKEAPGALLAGGDVTVRTRLVAMSLTL